MKCCPECGSTHIGPLVFYRPSIWKCQDCGYEGAFVIEIISIDELGQERCLRNGNIVAPMDRSSIDGWDGSTKDWWRHLGPS